MISHYSTHVVGITTSLVLTMSGCTPIEQGIGGIIGSTGFGANAPVTEMEQTYYLGAFDPQDQLPPTIYRIRVHGQASFISQTKFASGWVNAAVADSLNGDIAANIGQTGADQANKAKLVNLPSDATSSLSGDGTGRRLVLFGPEGFREAPKDHRLVIVMGSSPEAYFQAVDEALGTIAESRQDQADSSLGRKLCAELSELTAENDRLNDLSRDIEIEFPIPTVPQ